MGVSRICLRTALDWQAFRFKEMVRVLEANMYMSFPRVHNGVVL